MSDLPQLVRQCQAERQAFIRHGERASPACVELVQRAFTGDHPAWEALFSQVFADDIRRLIAAATQRYREQRGIGFGDHDREDALQETRLAFWRYAKDAPTLLASGDLDPVIAYLKKCVSSAVVTVARKLPPRHEETLSALAGEEADETSALEGQPRRKYAAPSERPFTESLEAIREIVEELQKLLQTDEERLIAQECFINETPPRELIEDYGHLFPGVDREAKLKYANQVLQKIRRRAEKSPTFQNLLIARRKRGSAAFLTYSLSDVSEVSEAMMPGSEPCAFDEATLLEYIQGNASTELSAAIERSPACVEAARRFAEEIAVLTPLLRLALCPEVETLLDYHTKRLPSAQQLVVYNHVQRCRQCQAEIAMFNAIDETPLWDEPSLLRRFFEAFFLPPTLSLAPVRGALPSLQYRTQIRTPAIDIFIFTQKSTGKGRTWTLRGELRTEEGLQFTGVEKIILYLSDPQPLPEAVELTTSLEEDGLFVFRGLEAGVYTLQVLTDEEEILIRALKVGDDT